MKAITPRVSVTTKEQREIRTSWGRLWPRMLAEARKHGAIRILFGQWSGYYSSQRRIVHVGWMPVKDTALTLTGVQFTDNTTLNIWTERLTVQQLLARKVARNDGYEKLIDEARASGESWYVVGRHEKAHEKVTSSCA